MEEGPHITEIADSASNVASNLLATRDIAALRSTCKFWRDVYDLDSDQLWSTLLERRFGGGRVLEDASLAQSVFKELAALRKAVVDNTVIWLNGEYLEEIEAPGSISNRVVRLNAVCWLALSAKFEGVTPGRYRAVCRLKCLPNFYTDELNIKAVPDEGCGTSASHKLRLDDLRQLSGRGVREGSTQGWSEVSTGVLEVREVCTVFVEVGATTGCWKQKIVFDLLRLVPI